MAYLLIATAILIAGGIVARHAVRAVHSPWLALPPAEPIDTNDMNGLSSALRSFFEGVQSTRSVVRTALEAGAGYAHWRPGLFESQLVVGITDFLTASRRYRVCARDAWLEAKTLLGRIDELERDERDRLRELGIPLGKLREIIATSEGTDDAPGVMIYFGFGARKLSAQGWRLRALDEALDRTLDVARSR